MSYFLKKTTPSKKGVYLQIYESYYVPGKGKRNKSYKKIGYINDLIEQGIQEPILHFQKEVEQLNEDAKAKPTPQISEVSLNKNVGYFLLKSMFDLLDMDTDIDIVSSNFKCKYRFSDMYRTLCYAQVISPGSKWKAFEKVIPNIYGMHNYSYDQILDFVNFIGSDYHKYIEVLNHAISKLWKRNFNQVYFDCTNYYFEMDLENDFLKKGPGKENRPLPLLGQALLLDADQIPLDTEFYPGNEGEQKYLRKRIEDMKSRNCVEGRLIQIADKGLNCAQNIYSAAIEGNDGYIFSKGIRGTKINKEAKEWILATDKNLNAWTEIRNENGELLYKYKVGKSMDNNGEVVDYGNYDYHFKRNPTDTEDVCFTVKEKRIVTYNPSLARKQRQEILREVDKIRNEISYKQVLKDDLGNSSKYVNLQAFDNNGKKVKIAVSINEENVQNELKFAGYNLIVTSEIYANPVDIYNAYHNLWRIEESFRLLKSYLEARPAYVRCKNTIYGHFLICYTALTIIRLLELKIFDDTIPASRLFEFIRQYNVTLTKENSFINTSTPDITYSAIKEKLGLSKLGNAYLSLRDINLLLDTELDIS